MDKLNCITINTDASYHNELKVGGYAFSIVCNLFRIKKGGRFKANPKNSEEAEIMCIGNAIATLLTQKELPQSNWLVINTDCKNAIRRIQTGSDPLGLQVKKIHGRLVTKLNSRNNQFRHVKAHSGKNDARSRVNEWCDAEAKKWMRLSVKVKAKQINETTAVPDKIEHW